VTTGASDDCVTPDASASLLELVSSCFVGDLETAADALVQHAAAERAGYVCLCNVHVLTTALHDVRVRAALNGAAIRFPDGEPVAWLLRRSGFPRARRIGGPDLFPRVIGSGRDVGLRHFLVGTRKPNLERLSRVIVDRYPGAEVVGVYAPPFADEPEVEDTLVEMVRAASAQLVWVALGAPKQELWMARAAPALPSATLVGVGAAFDFVGGAKRRAPELMQRAGLEWLHRMASEPRRLTMRYVRSNSEFVARTGFELARRSVRTHRR
jgi:N-acetylglucosaminyldiphosphoundecaprenol N-acetyl-beta-D-mannosaminyltransferase